MKALVLSLACLAAPAVAQDLTYSFAPVPECLDAAGSDVTARRACIGLAATACMNATEMGSTTVGMGFCFDNEWHDWDDRLNASYPRLMAQAERHDAEMKDWGATVAAQAEALRTMERDWIAFRDSACAFEASLWSGGTGAGPAATACMMQETALQALRLEEALGYFCEGDDCP